MHRLPSQRLSASHSVNIPADVSEIDRPSAGISERIERQENPEADLPQGSGISERIERQAGSGRVTA